MPQQIDGQSAGYTDAGSLETLGARGYTYDELERLTSVLEAGATVAEFRHDAAGHTVRVTDHSGPRTIVRHLIAPDFHWDETRSLASTQITVVGVRIATQVEPFTPSLQAGAMPGAPLGRPWVLGAVGAPAALALMLLLFQLVVIRRRGGPLLEPALAGGIAVAFYFWLSLPALAQIPDGDLDGNQKNRGGDGLPGSRAPARTASPRHVSAG